MSLHTFFHHSRRSLTLIVKREISYEVPLESYIEISIYDLRGQKIKTLINKCIRPGQYSINWDAGDTASGIYFVHFTASGEQFKAVSQIQKLTLLK